MPPSFSYFRDVADVSAGFVPKLEEAGECKLLQLANFSDEGCLLPSSSFTHVPLEQVPVRHQLQAGDVLLAAKGARLLAACVEAAWLPAVAATTLLVLRLRTEACLPAFLALWLNQPAMRLVLKSRLSATSVPTLNKRDLLELPLPGKLPSLVDQEHLLYLHQLRLEEKQLTLRLLQIREEEFNTRFAAHIAGGDQIPGSPNGL